MTEINSQIHNLFVREKEEIIQMTNEIFYEKYNTTFTNSLLFTSETLRLEVANNSIHAMKNQSFSYELWLGELLKYSKCKQSLPYKLCINESRNIIVLEKIEKGSLIGFITGMVEYRPLFSINRDDHFLYNIGYIYKRYIINMSKYSNAFRFLSTSPKNYNTYAVPIFINSIRYIALISSITILPNTNITINSEIY
ncbi:MAG: hypothetical protein KAH32_01300 [Chlamydiia bacterium]|nr:hypothetical protein [Chlamydiia bacterium]